MIKMYFEKKDRRKAFTLVEVLIVVLIIATLTAVALPIYRKAVEKSQAATALNVLNSIAVAEQSFFMAAGRYTTNYGELEENFADKQGQYAQDKTLTLKYFDVTLNGTEKGKGVVKAARSDGSYTLGKYYDGGRICCYQKNDTGFCDKLDIETCNLAEDVSQTCTSNSCVVEADTTLLTCRGENSCRDMSMTGGNLTSLICEGDRACYNMTSFTGENLKTLDCQGFSVCNNLTALTGGDISSLVCSGDYACNNMQSFNSDYLTELSCEGSTACSYMKSFTGDNLQTLNCQGSNACSLMTALSGESLTSLTCQGERACFNMTSLSGQNLTSLSCNGNYSCYSMSSLSGTNFTSLNCSGDRACNNMASFIGNTGTVITLDSNYSTAAFNSAYAGRIICPDSACVSSMTSKYKNATVTIGG